MPRQVAHESRLVVCFESPLTHHCDFDDWVYQVDLSAAVAKDGVEPVVDSLREISNDWVPV